MSTPYNIIAGQSAERLAALSDGIFAVAMTLLVLDLRVPAIEAVHSEYDLWRALSLLSPQIVMYMMTFMTLGIFWVGAADATELSCSVKPQSGVDPHRVPFRSYGYAIFDQAPSGIPCLPHCARRLLAASFSVRSAQASGRRV